MKNKQRLNELARFQAIAGVRSRNYLNEDDYSVPSDAISGDTAVDNIDEAGNIKGIKIEIPGNSYASDFGKAAAREVVASFGPNGAREFLEAFVDEIRKIATARMAARTKAPTAAPVAPTPGMQAEGDRTSGGFRIMDLDGEGITELVDIVDLADFERKVAQLEQASRKFQTAYTEMSEEVPHFADPITSDMADVFFGGDDPLTVEPNDSISFKDWAKSVVRAYNSSF